MLMDDKMYFLDGALYYLKGPGKAIKVVRGSEETNTIFKDFHDSSTGNHAGQKIPPEMSFQKGFSGLG